MCKLLYLNDLAFDTHFSLPENRFTLQQPQTGEPCTYDQPQMLLIPPQLVLLLATSNVITPATLYTKTLNLFQTQAWRLH